MQKKWIVLFIVLTFWFISIAVSEVFQNPIPEISDSDGICYIDFPAANFPVKSLGLGAPDKITIPFTNNGFFLVFKWTQSRITFIFKLVDNEWEIWGFYQEKMTWKEEVEMRKQIILEYFGPKEFIPDPLKKPSTPFN